MQSRAIAYELIKPKSLWWELPILASFNLLLVACAYIAFPLPFSPVPITGQTFGVLLIAMALGRVRGSGLMLAYVLEGAAGLPVFAGGAGGPQALMGPTGGYLLGFIVAAYIVGWLAERGWDRSIARSAIAMLIGYVIIFSAGCAMLSRFVSSHSLLEMGLMLFLPGMIVKIGLAVWVLPVVWKHAERSHPNG